MSIGAIQIRLDVFFFGEGQKAGRADVGGMGSECNLGVLYGHSK